MKGPCRVGLGLACLLIAAAQPARADDDADLSALKLADETPTEAASARPWRAFIEGALGNDRLRVAGTWQPRQRVSLGFRVETALTPTLRVAFADQLDLDRPAPTPGAARDINTFKEGYLSWQAAPDTHLDLGRVNVRNGVATGYNPTDYFKDSAVRSVVSVDPASLKENRQGSVMLRAQRLWSGGSFTALLSPRLASQPDASGFHPDWGATNGQDRWLLALSQELAPGVSPQVLVYKASGAAAQLGLNLTVLLNDATVAFVETSGGESPRSLTRILRQHGVPVADDSAWRQRAAAGITWTSADKLSLTFELDYDGNGLGRHAWEALQRGPLQTYGLYRSSLNTAQEPPTQHAAFAYARWQDALVTRLDLSGMVRHNLDDGSQMSWIEARYRFTGSEVALQWQRNVGATWSEYGAVAQVQRAQLEWRLYF